MPSARDVCGVPCLTDRRQNKWEQVSERQLDLLLDHVNTLNDTTPKIRAEGRQGVDPALIFGLDSKLFLEKEKFIDTKHHDEVETVTIYKGPQKEPGHHHNDGEGHACSSCNEGAAAAQPGELGTHVSEDELTTVLGKLKKESIWRVKGFVRTEHGPHILNWAFERFELTPLAAPDVLQDGELLKLTVMGERGEVRRIARRQLAEALGGVMH